MKGGLNSDGGIINPTEHLIHPLPTCGKSRMTAVEMHHVTLTAPMGYANLARGIDGGMEVRGGRKEVQVRAPHADVDSLACMGPSGERSGGGLGSASFPSISVPSLTIRVGICWDGSRSGRGCSAGGWGWHKRPWKQGKNHVHSVEVWHNQQLNYVQLGGGQ